MFMTKSTRAQSPAAFAEQYIVESIWQGRFPPGSILPAERELSELIGVTRTTLREVLQRLARDGWLTIQHGKPTQVNDYWHTAGLNILETLARLSDEAGSTLLIDQLLDARTALSSIYIRSAVRHNREKVLALLAESKNLDDSADAYIDFDWRLHHELSMLGGNPVYTLILNGFKALYHRVGTYYFTREEARRLADRFYTELLPLIDKQDVEKLIPAIYQYGRASGEIWVSVRAEMPQLSA